MVFRSKIDVFYVNFMLIVVLIIALGSLFPLFIEEVRNEWIAVLILVSIFIVLVSFILWTNFTVKYIFYRDYLFIKGGPFKSRIPYKNITEVSRTTAIFTGHRIMSSRDGLEIFNKTTFLGSIKISPKNKREFIIELKKRCPNIKIRE
ncbi:ABC-type transport system involved in multi-copper enzyme maturation permease subunit [Lederbergia galactosidilyticus]|uniref:PH domain-containing protein n=1 Tax=Lederbergia galactosidilytica TaxID=217031 RepID=UPI001AE9DC0D|nr:ABC-type transport system involved in multi-copper enzyme maturation permease subunit [Lederbergia galactosidilytica]